jgi:hypothetical protein
MGVGVVLEAKTLRMKEKKRDTKYLSRGSSPKPAIISFAGN